MLAYPVLYKLTFTKTVPFFSHHFDILFAIYSFVGLTALLFLALRKNLHKTAQLALSVLQTTLLALPLLEMAYFFYYGNCITEAAALSIYQANPAEAKEYILQALGYGGVLTAAIRRGNAAYRFRQGKPDGR